MKKIYVLDTSVLLHDESSWSKFEDNVVYIPLGVIEELERIKGESSERGRRSRSFGRQLLGLLREDEEGGCLVGGGVEVEINEGEGRLVIGNVDMGPGDEGILTVCKWLRDRDFVEEIVRLVTNDKYLEIKACLAGIICEPYKNDRVSNEYSGLEEKTCEGRAIDALYKHGYLELEEVGIERGKIESNKCVTLIDEVESKKTGLCVYKEEGGRGRLELLRTKDVRVSNIKALNSEQRFAIGLLLDPNIHLLTITGATGSGKTLLSLAAALQTIDDGIYQKLIITRPEVSVGNERGFLPGNDKEKSEPWLKGIYACINELTQASGNGDYAISGYDYYTSQGIVQTESLAYVRGMTWKSAIVLIDECFPEDAEILTAEGFKLFKDLDEETYVAAYSSNGAIKWEKPWRLIAKEYDDDLHIIKSDRYYSSVTKGHRRVFIDGKGNLITKEAQEGFCTDWAIPLNGIKEGGIQLSTRERLELQLAVALEADGNANLKKDTVYWQISLTKERKLERLRNLLDSLGLNYTEYPVDSKGRTRFYLGRVDSRFLKVDSSGNKLFKTPNLLCLSKEDLILLLEEVAIWNSSVLRNKRGQDSLLYCSKVKHNIDCIQAVAHLVGKNTKVGITVDSRKDTYKDYYKLNITNKSSTKMKGKVARTEPYRGLVYCCTVSTGMIVVRQSNVVSVSGNCQNLTRKEVKALITRAGGGDPPTKVVMLGDTEQIDHAYLDRESNGLSQVIDKFKGWKHYGHIKLNRTVRSALANEAGIRLS